MIDDYIATLFAIWMTLIVVGGSVALVTGLFLLIKYLFGIF